MESFVLYSLSTSSTSTTFFFFCFFFSIFLTPNLTDPSSPQPSSSVAPLRGDAESSSPASSDPPPVAMISSRDPGVACEEAAQDESMCDTAESTDAADDTQPLMYNHEEDQVEVKVVHKTSQVQTKEYEKAAKRFGNANLLLRKLIDKEKFKNRSSKEDKPDVQTPVTKEEIVYEILLVPWGSLLGDEAWLLFAMRIGDFRNSS